LTSPDAEPSEGSAWGEGGTAGGLEQAQAADRGYRLRATTTVPGRCCNLEVEASIQLC